MKKKVLIPKGINIENLLGEENVKGRPDFIENIRNGIIYFLGLLHQTDRNRYLFDDNGYRNLSSQYLTNIIGKGSANKRRLNIIKDILISNNIIEVKNYLQNVKSYGYRISSKLLSGDFNEYELGNKIIDNLKKFKENLEKEGLSEIKGVDYDILKEQFELNEISFDSRVYNYLRDFTQKGLERIEKKQKNEKETYQNLFNYIGKLLNHIEKM
jgi:hypothetical protein